MMAMTISPAMSSKVQDVAAIETVVKSVGVLADSGDFDALESLYAEEIVVDYTSLNGGTVELKSSQALMSQWASVLPGFDLTRHNVSGIVVTIDGAKATATADVVADHYVQSLHWQVSGRYQYKLEKMRSGWKIASHTFLLDKEVGTRDVFQAAIGNALEHPSDYVLRKKTQDAVKTFLTSLESKNMADFASVWAEDAVQEMPYAPEGFPQSVKGKEALLKHYAGWPENSGDADFTSELIFYPMEDPEVTFVEFKGKVNIIPTGRVYDQHYGGLFHVENGKIKLFREYFNPAPFVYAFGLDDGGQFN